MLLISRCFVLAVWNVFTSLRHYSSFLSSFSTQRSFSRVNTTFSFDSTFCNRVFLIQQPSPETPMSLCVSPLLPINSSSSETCVWDLSISFFSWFSPAVTLLGSPVARFDFAVALGFIIVVACLGLVISGCLVDKTIQHKLALNPSRWHHPVVLCLSKYTAHSPKHASGILQARPRRRSYAVVLSLPTMNVDTHTHIAAHLISRCVNELPALSPHEVSSSNLIAGHWDGFCHCVSIFPLLALSPLFGCLQETLPQSLAWRLTV